VFNSNRERETIQTDHIVQFLKRYQQRTALISQLLVFRQLEKDGTLAPFQGTFGFIRDIPRVIEDKTVDLSFNNSV
jgi:hypothetical protein